MTNEELIKKHHDDCSFCSIMGHMRRSSSTYEQIVTKGMDIVPDILKYLRAEEGGMSIMLLLWDITKISPYQPEIIGGVMAGYKVSDARQAWIDWGIKEKHIEAI